MPYLREEANQYRQGISLVCLRLPREPALPLADIIIMFIQPQRVLTSRILTFLVLTFAEDTGSRSLWTTYVSKALGKIIFRWKAVEGSGRG